MPPIPPVGVLGVVGVVGVVGIVGIVGVGGAGSRHVFWRHICDAPQHVFPHFMKSHWMPHWSPLQVALPLGGSWQLMHAGVQLVGLRGTQVSPHKCVLPVQVGAGSSQRPLAPHTWPWAQQVLPHFMKSQSMPHWSLAVQMALPLVGS